MCAQGSILLQIPPAGGSELNEMQDRIDGEENAKLVKKKLTRTG